MLTELTELSHKMKDQMKAIQSKIKQNIQGTNSEGQETGTHINDLEQKDGINIQNRMKKQEFKKMRRGLEPPGQLSTFQYLNHKGTRRRSTRARS